MIATTRASFLIAITAFMLMFLSLAPCVDAYDAYRYDAQDTLCMRYGCCDCERNADDDGCDRQYQDRHNDATYPSVNVFVPDEHENIAFIDLTFEELNDVTMSAYGRAWNNMDALCASMLMRFGRAGDGCTTNMPDTFIRPVTARAQVSFIILPQPTVVVPAKPIMIVDPVYPPWTPTYNPYW